MLERIKTSVYLDARSKDKDRTNPQEVYPLKLYVYSKELRKFKHFGLPELEPITQTAFEKSYLASKPRANYKELHLFLKGLESKAMKVGNSLTPFSFDRFESLYFSNTSKGANVYGYFNRHIDSLYEAGRIGTAKYYECSRNAFYLYKTGKRWLSKKELAKAGIAEPPLPFLPFTTVTAKELE